MAKCFCIGAKSEIAQAFKGKNFGVGCRGGVEAVAHSLRSTLTEHRGSGMALLKIDFKNAFNSIERAAFVPEVVSRFPGLAAWTRWCYSAAPALIYDHQHIFWSENGVQQGDPLGPLYFCCGLQPFVDKISLMCPPYQKWYMDDGGIVVSPELLQSVWDLLASQGPAVGLHLNPAKCEWTWLDPLCSKASPLPGVPLTELDRIHMLGVPLGSDVNVSAFVEDKLIGRAKGVMEKLAGFEDTQSALFLLRLSFASVRAVHFMRTTPLASWPRQAEDFDNLVRATAEQILGCTFSLATYEQACLSPSVGGLGLRRVSVHADAAFAASWYESRRTCDEKWVLPGPLPESYRPQSVASSSLDEDTASRLSSSAPSLRESRRIDRLSAPHACSWVTALPSSGDGSDTIMAPKVFRTAVRRLLGLPVFPSPVPCPLCMQTMDIFGDHAVCCSGAGDLVVRHNRVRNIIFKLAEYGLMTPEMEKVGILGPTDDSKRRPGDVSIRTWGPTRGLAIDVAVICPFASCHMDKKEPCEAYALGRKHRKYDGGFEGSEYDFCPVVFEVGGGVNREGLAALKRIISCAAKRDGTAFSAFCARAWARISCSIQNAAAQAIVSRDTV